jgi:hypothetical protein
MIMRTNRLRFATSLLVLFGAGSLLPAGEPHTVYEWLAIAPVVLTGEHVRKDGKYAEFHVDTVLRGDSTPAGTIRIAVRRANRDRNRHVVKEALKFEKGMSYLLLLTPARKSKADAPPTFDLVRGARGAREIPPEGHQAFLAAVERFVRIQDRDDELFSWREFREMLDDPNPLVIETALDQFLKFGRGDNALLGTLRPLLDHPSPEMRTRTAQLIGLILHRGDSDSVPDLPVLQSELSAKARRDGSVPVRIAATEALNEIESSTVESILDEIAEEDPDQTVRYTAERLIYERRPQSRKAKENGGRAEDLVAKDPSN